jgi:hypothetical protein
MLVACRRLVYPRLRGSMTASTSAYKSVGGAPARRKRANPPFSRLGISRAGLQALGHGVALPGCLAPVLPRTHNVVLRVGLS